MPILLFPEGYISVFFFLGGGVDHNLEIRIGSKGSVVQARGVRWGWEHYLPLPMPRTGNLVCPGLILWPISPPPCMCTCVHLFFLSSLLGGVAGSFGCVPGPFYVLF
jgi:hypothetical protein